MINLGGQPPLSLSALVDFLYYERARCLCRAMYGSTNESAVSFSLRVPRYLVTVT